MSAPCGWMHEELFIYTYITHILHYDTLDCGYLIIQWGFVLFWFSNASMPFGYTSLTFNHLSFICSNELEKKRLNEDISVNLKSRFQSCRVERGLRRD